MRELQKLTANSLSELMKELEARQDYRHQVDSKTMYIYLEDDGTWRATWQWDEDYLALSERGSNELMLDLRGREERRRDDKNDELRRVQQELGCEGCYYADQKALRKGIPCCTRVKPSLSDSEGRCLGRKER